MYIRILRACDYDNLHSNVFRPDWIKYLEMEADFVCAKCNHGERKKVRECCHSVRDM